MKNFSLGRAFFIASLFCAASAARALPSRPLDMEADIRLMRAARAAFRSNDFGEAFKLSEQAKIERKKTIKWQRETLVNSFKSKEVKKAKGVLSDIIPILEEREEYDAIGIIKRFVQTVSPEKIKDSSEALLECIDERSSYPEADWLIARVYKLEGDYDLARQYLTQAWRDSAVLDVPAERSDILYDLAEIARIQGDMDNFEKDLLLIVDGDSGFNRPEAKRAMLARITANQKGDMEKFFTMFRCDDYYSIKAYRYLSEFYEREGEGMKSLACAALGALAGFTKIHEAIKASDPEYEYTRFALFLDEAASREEIVEWGDDEKIWRLFNELAAKAREQGGDAFSFELLSALSESSPSEKFRKQAAEAMLASR